MQVKTDVCFLGILGFQKSTAPESMAVVTKGALTAGAIAAVVVHSAHAFSTPLHAPTLMAASRPALSFQPMLGNQWRKGGSRLRTHEGAPVGLTVSRGSAAGLKMTGDVSGGNHPLVDAALEERHPLLRKR